MSDATIAPTPSAMRVRETENAAVRLLRSERALEGLQLPTPSPEFRSLHRSGAIDFREGPIRLEPERIRRE